MTPFPIFQGDWLPVATIEADPDREYGVRLGRVVRHETRHEGIAHLWSGRKVLFYPHGAQSWHKLVDEKGDRLHLVKQGDIVAVVPEEE